MDLVCSTLDAVPGSKLILGNHDEFLLRVLDLGDDSGPMLARWAVRYGAPILASYGLLDCKEAKMVPQIRRDRFPLHVDALRQASSIIVEGDYAFVHAGVRPGVPLELQNEKDLRWIRDDFLACDEPFEKIVIHGHTETVRRLPEVFPNRNAIDTGAYRTGMLSAAVVSPGAKIRFLMASKNGIQEVALPRPTEMVDHDLKT
jgi:serine/threonine protein phosphatase 1